MNNIENSPVLKEAIVSLNTTSPDKRKRSLIILGDYSVPALLPTVVPFLADPEQTVRSAAAYAIGEMGLTDTKGVAMLAELLWEGEPVVKIAILTSIHFSAQITVKSLICPVLACLFDLNDEVKRFTCICLIGLGIERISQSLEENSQFGSNDWQKLIAFPNGRGIAHLLMNPVSHHLMKHSLPHLEVSFRLAATVALACESTQVVNETYSSNIISTSTPKLDLREFLNGHRIDQPNHMTETLQNERTQLTALLADPRSVVRQVVAYGLGLINAASATPLLLKAAADDSDVVVRFYSLVAVGKVGSRNPKTAEILANHLLSPEVEVRKGASLALELFGPDAAFALPHLLKALSDNNLTVQEELLSTIARIRPTSWAVVEQIVPLFRRCGCDGELVRRSLLRILPDLLPESSAADVEKEIRSLDLNEDASELVNRVNKILREFLSH